MTEQIELTAEQQRELDQIEQRLDIVREEIEALYDEYEFREMLDSEVAQGTDNWYSNHPKLQEQERLLRQRKLLQGYSLSDSRMYNTWHRVPFLVFVDGCLAGDFTDNSVYAFYATRDKVSNIRLAPSDILERLYRNDFQYVVYSNR